MVGKRRAREADPGAAAGGSGKDLAAKYTSTPAQFYDDVGRPLPPWPRPPVEGAPQLAVSSVWRLAVERWVEATP